METSVQLYRRDHKLTACALGDPSITLIQNDGVFGLLIADGAHEDSFSGRFYLDTVSYLAVRGGEWSCTGFESVVIQRDEQRLWVAQDAATGCYFRNPSFRPYETLFIFRADYERLQKFRTNNTPRQIVEFAMNHFGCLPGFYRPHGSLSSPGDYATAGDPIPISSPGYVDSLLAPVESGKNPRRFRQRIKAAAQKSRAILEKLFS